MKTLLTNIKTFLEADITAGEIDAKKVLLGLHEDPSQVPITEYPYICIDEAGERNEETSATDSVWRIYTVVIEFATFHTNRETSLKKMLDLNDQVRASIEKQTNRQKDDMVWGIVINPFTWASDQYFFRARNVRIDYRSYAETYEERY